MSVLTAQERADLDLLRATGMIGDGQLPGENRASVEQKQASSGACGQLITAQERADLDLLRRAGMVAIT